MRRRRAVVSSSRVSHIVEMTYKLERLVQQSAGVARCERRREDDERYGQDQIA